MKNKTLRSIILIVIGGLIAIYIITFFYGAIKQDMRNPAGMMFSAPGNYINLFNKDSQKKIIIVYTIFAKYRDSISYLTYENKYDIEIYKIKTTGKLNLINTISECYNEPEGVYTSNTVGVAPYNENNFVINYKGGSTETASKIYLSLIGDSTKTILKNDSIATYFLKVKNMYVQYKLNSDYQIYIQAKSNFYKQPVILSFLTKHNSLYFLLLTSKQDNERLDVNLLNKLIVQ